MPRGPLHPDGRVGQDSFSGEVCPITLERDPDRSRVRTERSVTQLQPIQRLALFGVVVIGALTAFSSAPGLWITLFGYESWKLDPQFLIAGFEGMTLAAGITAILLGIRRDTEGFGIAMLCAAGAIFVGSFLGATMLQSTSEQVPSLMNFVKLRLALMLGLLALTGVVKLGVRGDCWRKLVLGGVMLLPAGAIGGLVVLNRTGALTDPIGKMGEVAQMVVWLTIAIVLGILTVAGGHFVIRAFEMTREAGAKAGDAKAE